MNQLNNVDRTATWADRCPRLICSAVAVGLVIGWSDRSAAAEPPAPAARPTVEGPIQYVGPDTYILLDAEGRAQPMLGMSYEELMATWKRSQRIESQVVEPRFTIDALQARGEAKDGHAELEVTLTIRPMTSSAIEVPLGMARGILREPPSWDVIDNEPVAEDEATTEASETSASPYVDFVPERGGFVAGFREQQPKGAEGDRRRRLTLRLLVPLLRDANETSLPLNLPRALVSKLSLDVPAPIAAAVVNDGSLLAREATESGGTRLVVTGPTGDFRLTWSTAESRRPELATVLSATGAIAIAIDGHSIRSDARLTVRSYGGSFDRFRVRLPPGAKLVEGGRHDEVSAAAPEYRVTVEETAASIGGPAARSTSVRQVVVVELPEPQLGPIEVNLATEQPLGLPGADTAVELAGFEVLGAVRQFGDVALDVADDWQLRWEIGPNVRQIERGELSSPQSTSTRSSQPAPGTREALPAAAFQYDRAPWSLRARVVERQFRVHVTPSYVLDVGANEARLRVGLTYQVPGARAFEFRIQLAGWELTPEPIESEGLVDRDRVQVASDGLLLLPLAQASPRRAEIAFVLRRDVSANSVDGIDLPLPLPEADTVAAAELTVRAAPGIELRLDSSRSTGLTPTPVTDDAPPSASRGDGGQQLRYRAFLPDAVFAAVRTIRPREVETNVVTQLAIDSNRVVAEQTVSYSVRHQPIEQLTLSVPDGWTLVDDQVETVIGAAAVASSDSDGAAPPTDRQIVLTAEPSTAADEPARRVIRVPLPQPRLGRFQTRLALVRDHPADQPLAGPVLLALPGPSDGLVTSHRVSVTSPPTLEVAFDATADQSTWRTTSRDAAPGTIMNRAHANDSILELVADVAEPILPLVIRPIDPQRVQATSVERVWLQTWQAGSQVQERAALRFHTTGPNVVVELPPGTPPQEVEVLVDGQLADVAARDEGRVVVALTKARPNAAGENTQNRHTLELRYRRPASAAWLARETLTPPQLAGMSTLGEVYWQLILPAGVHVMQTPDPLVPVDRWQWFEVFWGRQPLLGQAELEDWSGAIPSDFVPSSGQTAYLYSGLAPVTSIEVLTAPRWLIVLASSGVVLAVGCAWIYLPVVRRAWIGLLLAIAVAALAVTYPVAAVLVGQASVVGWILALVALGLRGWMARPSSRQPLTTGSTQLRLRLQSRSDSHPTPPVEISTGRAPATPISVPETD